MTDVDDIRGVAAARWLERAARAEVILRSILDNGPVPAANVHRIAHERGIPLKALREAAHRLDVRYNRAWKVRGGTVFWTLPQHDNPTVARQFWRRPTDA